jgi:hypothetical protein
MENSGKRWGLPTALILLVVGALQASSVISLSENGLIDGSTAILRGFILGSETAYGSGAISVYTDVTMEVTEVLKGTVSDTIVHLSLPGGELGNRVIYVPGTPRFHDGEEVCVFVIRLPNGLFTLRGMGQGKYHLATNPASGLTVAVRDQTHIGLQVRPSPGQTQRQALRSRAPDLEHWDVFRRRIRARVEGMQ